MVIIQPFFFLSRQTVLIEPFQNTNTKKIHRKDGDSQPAFIFLSKFLHCDAAAPKRAISYQLFNYSSSTAAKKNHLTKAARVDKNKQCKDASACGPPTKTNCA